jgi:chromosomal replication initiation ATPase DnaA
MDGMSNVSMRPRMQLDDFLELGSAAVGISVADLRSRKRGTEIVEAREILAWLGVELYGLPVREIAEGLDKHLETASRLVSRAAERRAENESFGAKVQRVDEAIISLKTKKDVE